MVDELDGVKKLGVDEEFVRLQNLMQSNYNELQHIQKKSMDEDAKQKNDFIENDIQHKTNQTKLRNLEVVYKTIFENSAVAITLTDENERIIFWNKYAENLLGMEKDDLYMKPVKSLYPPDEWKKIRSENVRQKGMQHHLETKILRKNSEPLDIDISLSVLKDHGGKIVGSIGVIKNISERKRAEKKLRELNQILEEKVYERTADIKELLRQKDEFIGQLGHDLKTPLSVLMNILPIVKEDSDEPEVKKDCEMAIRNVNYIRYLTKETLNIAELSSPNIQFDVKDTDLLDVVDNVIEDNHYVFEEKNIKIKNMINEKIIIKADKLRLGEIFNNLISNAIKYSDDDGGTITIDAHRYKDSVTISVRDTGIGIIKEQLKYVFDDFYKVDNSRHSLGSCGLGLSICRRIVEKHGGKIWVESPGLKKGTTFYFTILSSSEKVNGNISENVDRILKNVEYDRDDD